ncbi:MAG: hypothetical protein ABSE49_26090 [Polyangiaceae bacterium]
MRTRRVVGLGVYAAIVAACGSRTGLLVPTETDAGHADSSVPHDARPPEVGVDVQEEPDVVEEDALPPIDVIVTPPPNPCPDAGSTLVYVITSQNVLLSFYPPTAAFTTIGSIVCPDTTGDSPFSMAVDHTGIAYVAFQSGNVFRVSTANAACVATKRNPTTAGVFDSQYGMGFSANVGADGGFANDGGDAGDNVETLYLAGNPGGLDNGFEPIVLGSMSTTTFLSSTIGTVTPSIYGAELTGTGSGELFAFYVVDPNAGGAAIGELDRTTAQLVAMNPLPGVDIAGGWAFAFWGGNFYTFTAPGGPGSSTLVQRFDPSDGTVSMITTINNLTVVGAGVSTCAPQQ